jgi:hypothetical protein
VANLKTMTTKDDEKITHTRQDRGSGVSTNYHVKVRACFTESEVKDDVER